MTAIDISTLTLPELKDLQANVARMIETRNAEATAGARAQILAIAKEAGLDLKDLVAHAKPAGNKAPIKYRDPANDKNVWTGRGRAPRWALAMQQAGTFDTARVM